jgi:hypothetical protein
VITHHRVGADINGKYTGEKMKAIFHPLAAVLVGFTGILVNNAEKRPSHAPRRAVVIRRGIE